MDPLSITTAVITLTTLLGAALNQSQLLRDAPAEIHELANEVADLEVVVQEIAKALNDGLWNDLSFGMDSEADGLTTLLSRARQKLLELEALVRRIGIRQSPGGSRVSTRARFLWLREKSKVDTLRRDLNGIKLSLVSVLEARNSINISRIYLRLEDISYVNGSGSLKGHDVERRVATQPSTKDSQCQKNDYEGQITETRDQVNHHQQDSEGDDEKATPQTQTQHVGHALSRMLQDQSGTLLLHATRSRCPQGCSCICHKTSRLNSPRLLNDLFGAISINYSGVPCLSSPCNEKRCRPRSSASARVTYQFPSWLLARALSMIVVCSKLNGPEMQLRTLRVIPANATIFRLALAGDVDGMQALFRQGRASIYDIDDTRWSILHKAFLNGQSRVCKFLLEQGADPTLEATNGSSVVVRAWLFDRTNTGYKILEDDDFLYNILRSVDFDSLAEFQQYTTLHKIVLGLSSLDLETQLQHSTAAIDTVDAKGRTALWWAAARGDSNAIRTLLEYGAAVDDPAFPNSHSALHVAQTPAAVKLLIAHGARIDCRDEARRTPLHCCAYRGPTRGGSLALLECLLDCGADIHAQTAAGHTALHYAAQFGLLPHAQLLVSRGAALEARKRTGLTPLLEAVSCGRLDVVPFLLDSGADLSAKNVHARNVLHLVAERGDSCVMDCLADLVQERYRRVAGMVDVDIVDVDVDALDVFGLTPRCVFDNRTKDLSEADPDGAARLREAFDRLLSVFRRCASARTAESGDGDVDGDGEAIIFTPETDSDDESDGNSGEEQDEDVFEDARQ